VDRQEWLGLIEDYRSGLLPLIVPLTLLKHHLNRHPVPDWVHQQVYLNPWHKALSQGADAAESPVDSQLD
jgi:uncharacterized protein YbgA (DUF1722 family)